MLETLLNFDDLTNISYAQSQKFIADQFAFETNEKILEATKQLKNAIPVELKGKFDSNGSSLRYLFLEPQEINLVDQIILPLTLEIQNKAFFSRKLLSTEMIALTPIGVKITEKAVTGHGISYNFRDICYESDLCKFNTNYKELEDKILDIQQSN